VPVTPDTRVLVVEMGARGIGHIAYLTRIAPPRIGVVLNVGTAHVGEFGGQEAIATAKSELVEALPARRGRRAQRRRPRGAAMAGRTTARWSSSARRRRAGAGRATSSSTTGAGRASRGHTPAGTRAVSHLGLVGRHHVGNALAVIAVAMASSGCRSTTSCSALGQPGPVSRWRMEVTERPDGVTVVNDAYNANPDSMRAALGPAAGRMGRGGAPGPCSGRCSSSGRSRDHCTREVGADVVAPRRR
jgi:UDP-N-acetylmuramoyl-tripeptide--D-alanyl-D-alanine ligase